MTIATTTILMKMICISKMIYNMLMLNLGKITYLKTVVMFFSSILTFNIFLYYNHQNKYHAML